MRDLQQKILDHCIEIDTFARRVYASFEETEKDPGLAAIWRGMKEDEENHIRYWKILGESLKNAILPTLVDEAGKVLSKLEGCVRDIRDMPANLQETTDTQQRLAIACRVEISFLDETLLQLLRYVETVDRGEEAMQNYNRHLEEFIRTVASRGSSPELRLLALAIQHLWEDNRKLLQLSTVDTLTGLLNRRGFFQSAVPLTNLVRRKGEGIAVAMADIDRFKSINDSHGHPEGDRILARTAAAIQGAIRVSDIAGRYGGEEFIVLLSPVQPESLANVGEKIRSSVEVRGEKGVPATVSLGIAWCTPARNEEAVPLLDALAKKADEYLYRAKETGRNRVVIGEKA
jgi:diguanylate cyclase (GGDEF)-like protein